MDPKKTDSTERPSRLQVVCAIFAYVTTSSMLVYSNKFLMQPEISIPAPLLVTWFQCVFTVAMIRILAIIHNLIATPNLSTTPQPDKLNSPNNSAAPFAPGTDGGGEGRSVILGKKAGKMGGRRNLCLEVVVGLLPKKVYSYDRKVGRATIGMSVAFVAMMSFTNICLKYVEVSFYQVARGLTPVINSLLSYIFLSQSTSLPTGACLAMILFGYYLGVQGEIKFSLIGTIFGFTSSILCVMYPIFTKKQINLLNDKWGVIFYNNVHASFMFLPMILICEVDIIRTHSDKFQNPKFWFWILVASLLGSVVGLTAITQLKLTSPLSHNVIGNAKGAGQSILGAYIWNTPLTTKGVFGLLTVLSGSLLYAYTRMDAKNLRTHPTHARASNKPSAVTSATTAQPTIKCQGADTSISTGSKGKKPGWIVSI
ncbi:hypothetical protein AAMO2058_001306100 [Amorphochlora amoebiformis]